MPQYNKQAALPDAMLSLSARIAKLEQAAAARSALWLPVRYHRAAAYSLIGAAWTAISLDTKDYDASNGAYTLTGGALKVAAAGYYLCSTDLYASGFPASQSLTLAILRNGTRVGKFGFSVTSAFNQVQANTTDIVQCAAGDTLGFGYYASSAGGAVLAADGTPPDNSLTVARVV